MLAFVNEVFVSLVGDDDETSLLREARDCRGLVAREDHTVRILRSVEIDGARARGRVARKYLGEAVPASFGCRHEHGYSVAVRDEVFDRRPVRREDQNLVAGIYDRLECAEEYLHPSVAHDNIRIAHVDAISLIQLRCNRAAKFGNPG